MMLNAARSRIPFSKPVIAERTKAATIPKVINNLSSHVPPSVNIYFKPASRPSIPEPSDADIPATKQKRQRASIDLLQRFVALAPNKG